MFFIIWGSRAIKKTIGDGLFFCPKCGADRQYRLQRVRRWFTLFFIPLFPMGDPLGEQIECSTCKSHFRPDALKTPTSAELTEYLRNATRVCVAALVRAADVDDVQMRAASVELVRSAGVADYSDEILTSDCHQVLPTKLPSYVAPLAIALSDAGKESFVAQIAKAGAIGNSLSAGQVTALERIGGALGLSPTHVTGIIVTATAAPRTTSSADELPPPSAST